MTSSVQPNSSGRGRMVYVRAKGKTTASRSGHWADKIKMKAVEMVMAGLTTREISLELKVPFNTIVQWRRDQWFKDTVKEIQEDDGHKLDHKITAIMHNSLDAMTDRLANGDHIRDDKTGKIVRVPVKIRDATNTFNTLMDKRQLLRKQPTKITDNASVNQQLHLLAQEFKKFLGKPVTEEQQTSHIIEGEHVFINENGEGEWIEPEESTDGEV
jgi:hypothetical protein